MQKDAFEVITIIIPCKRCGAVMNRRRWMALSCALITLALVVGGASIPAAAYTPTIYGVTPSDGATGVSKNTDIVIKWTGTSRSDFLPVLVDPTGGPNIGLLTYKLRIENNYDPYGQIISTYYASYCYPADASNNRLSLASDTQYNVGMMYSYDHSEVHIISSFTTGSQSTPTWSGWQSMGGQLLAGTGPAACNWGSDQTDWFVTGTNHNLYHSWTGSSGWENLGGYLTSSPAAYSSGNGVIDVGARGSNGALYTRHYSGPTGGPTIPLGLSRARITLFTTRRTRRTVAGRASAGT